MPITRKAIYDMRVILVLGDELTSEAPCPKFNLDIFAYLAMHSARALKGPLSIYVPVEVLTSKGFLPRLTQSPILPSKCPGSIVSKTTRYRWRSRLSRGERVCCGGRTPPEADHVAQ